MCLLDATGKRSVLLDHSLSVHGSSRLRRLYNRVASWSHGRFISAYTDRTAATSRWRWFFETGVLELRFVELVDSDGTPTSIFRPIAGAGPAVDYLDEAVPGLLAGLDGSMADASALFELERQALNCGAEWPASGLSASVMLVVRSDRLTDLADEIRYRSWIECQRLPSDRLIFGVAFTDERGESLATNAATIRSFLDAGIRVALVDPSVEALTQADVADLPWSFVHYRTHPEAGASFSRDTRGTALLDRFCRDRAIRIVGSRCFSVGSHLRPDGRSFGECPELRRAGKR